MHFYLIRPFIGWPIGNLSVVLCNARSEPNLAVLYLLAFDWLLIACLLNVYNVGDLYANELIVRFP